jgi:hypothetical protein
MAMAEERDEEGHAGELRQGRCEPHSTRVLVCSKLCDFKAIRAGPGVVKRETRLPSTICGLIAMNQLS